METFLYATAVTLGGLLVAAWLVASALCAGIVLYVALDVYRTIKIRKQRRDGMQ
jgi:hypothetical protein